MSAPRKLAVITGGGSGIGACIALALARQQWDLCITTFHDGDEAARTIRQARTLGAVATSLKCDVGSKAEVDSFYEAVSARFGKAPDLLVNNAGVQTWAGLLELREEDWDRVIRTNLKGCFLNIQAAARLMVAQRQGGRIVNIGSGCNRMPFPRLVDYSASKGGIEMLTKVAAIELGRHGIRVNCVAPGAIETARTRQEDRDYAGSWARVTPLGRVGQPEDVADAVCFLAGEAAGFISGQTLHVDGGVFTRPNWPYPEL